MNNRHYQISTQRQAVASRIYEGIIAVTLGALLGLALVYFRVQALVVIGAGVLLLIFPIQPEKFLLGYLVVMPLIDQLAPFFTGKLFGLRFGPQILFRGGVTVLLIYYWLIKQRDLLVFKVARPMFILLSLLALMTLSSGIMVQLGLVNLAKLAFWMLLLLTVADMVTQKKIKLRIIYRCMMFSVLIFIASLLISEFWGIEVEGYRGYNVGEVTGVFGPHSVVLCLSMGLVVVLALVTKQQNKLSVLLLWLFSVMIVISIGRTYVRTGYTAFISALFTLNFMFWRYGKHESSQQQKLILGATFTIIIGAITLYTLTHIEPLKERFSDFFDYQRAGSGRFVMYKAALKTYADYPIFKKIFGGGLGADFAYYPGRNLATHNDYLSLLLSGGLVGISLYLWLFMSLWKQIKSSGGNTSLPLIIASCAIVIYLVAAVTNNVMTYMSVMTNFSFLVGGAIGYVSKEERDIIHEVY